MTAKRVWVDGEEYIKVADLEKALEEIAQADLYAWSPFGIVFVNNLRKKLNG